MNLLEMLKGKRMKVMTDMNFEVEVIIESEVENTHTRDLPPEQFDDWMPREETWHSYTVKFTNGGHKVFSKLSEIQIIEK